MKALLDTHVFLWAAVEPEKLSEHARDVCESAELLLSVASVWEIAIKVQIGRLVLPQEPRKWILRQVEAGEISVLPIHARHAFRAGELPLTHHDPFDRMLVAQAVEEKLAIVSGDAALSGYPVEIIW